MSGMQDTPKILVVDDEPDLEPLMLQRMRRDIRRGRYRFVFARNGVEALEMLDKDPDIDMVLSDINMPRMDGLALLSQIAKVAPNLRSVIISAYGDMKNIRTAMNRGAFDFVTKPIDFDDLRVTIDRTLRHLAEWREAIASRDKLITLQNELDVASKIQQSILPTQLSERRRLRGLRQHGAGPQRGRRFLRRAAAGVRPHRPGHRGRIGQGRSGGAFHDVHPYVA